MFRGFYLVLFAILTPLIVQAEFAQQCKDLINEKGPDGRYIYWSGTKLKDKAIADDVIRKFYLGKLYEEYVTKDGVSPRVNTAVDAEIAELKQMNDKKWSPNMLGSASGECLRVLSAYPKESLSKALEFNHTCGYKCPGLWQGVTKTVPEFSVSVYGHLKGGDTDVAGLGREIQWYEDTCKASAEKHEKTAGWCADACTSSNSEFPFAEQVDRVTLNERLDFYAQCERYGSVLKGTLIADSIDGKMQITDNVHKALLLAYKNLAHALTIFHSDSKKAGELISEAEDILRANGSSPGKPEVLLQQSIALRDARLNANEIRTIQEQLKKWLHDCFPKPYSSPAVTCRWAEWHFRF